MNQNELSEATKAIGMMLEAFPSSQSRITGDTAKVYRFAIEDCSLEAVKRACRAFVRGEVAGHNPDFAPTAPRLVQVVKEFEHQLVVESWKANRQFIAVGSDQWHQIAMLKNDPMLPTFVKDGVEGWWFDNKVVDEAAMIALPPPISEAQMAANRARLSRLGIGDPDAENGDMGQVGAA
jgi:hypothetical protein